MSRIGNNPISIANDVVVKINGKTLEVSGKNGSQSFLVHNNILMLRPIHHLPFPAQKLNAHLFRFALLPTTTARRIPCNAARSPAGASAALLLLKVEPRPPFYQAAPPQSASQPQLPARWRGATSGCCDAIRA